MVGMGSSSQHLADALLIFYFIYFLFFNRAEALLLASLTPYS